MTAVSYSDLMHKRLEVNCDHQIVDINAPNYFTCTRFTQEISSEAGSDGLRQRLAKVHLRFYAALFAAIFVTFYCRTV